MHVPDGFLDAATSIGTAAVSAGVVAVAVRRARAELDDRTAPVAGLVAVFVFAVQMLNFPVGIGTSGHLMGGALAAVLVGPWTAVLCLTVVLGVQGLVFADGGLTALGTNVLLIGIVTTLVGWVVTRAALRALPARPASVVPAAALGAFLSVPAAAVVFTLLYAVGGAVSLPLGGLLSAMLGWHALIGLGEAVITAATVTAVVAVRPDLVHAARGLLPATVLVGARTEESANQPAGVEPLPRRGVGGLVLVGLAVSAVLAGVVSFVASGSPDGLERVAEDTGFGGSAADHALGGFVLADYGDVGGIPVGLAGLLGIVITVGVALTLFVVLAGRRVERSEPREKVGSSQR